jgi:hypothetical protein
MGEEARAFENFARIAEFLPILISISALKRVSQKKGGAK